MNLKQIIHASVLGASRYDFDGNQGAKVFLQQAAKEDNPDTVGVDVMAIPAFYGVVENLRKHPLPGDFELEAEMRKVGGGKAGLFVTGLRPMGKAQPAQPANAK
jgi:hypothetical protein